MKTTLVERIVCTMTERTHKYLPAKNTYRSINVLNDLVHSYNHTVHCTIKMAPVDVTDSNAKSGKHSMITQKNICKLDSGMYVRVGKYKHILEKG